MGTLHHPKPVWESLALVLELSALVWSGWCRAVSPELDMGAEGVGRDRAPLDAAPK